MYAYRYIYIYIHVCMNFEASLKGVPDLVDYIGTYIYKYCIYTYIYMLCVNVYSNRHVYIYILVYIYTYI
jgi:hypothetical protein